MGSTRCFRSCKCRRACRLRASASTARRTLPCSPLESSGRRPDPSLDCGTVIARYARPAMAKIWSDESRLAHWLDVELAALDAWAEVGTVPAEDVAEIRARAVAPSPERVAEIERVTDHDVAAFVDAVSEQLGPAGRWVHYGLTSSDVVDTALSLQIRDAGRLIVEGIDRSLAAVVAQAGQHRNTICIGRSHGIHAEPTTFGWKLAGWAFELDRTRTRVVHALETNRVGQL